MAFEGLRVTNSMTLERDTLLNNRYRIVEILGQGGMASIYRAIDENLGVEVAVKENMFTTEEYARQFRREAVILASLRHPHLPRVTDHFVIENQGQYLVMDYIEGEDMRQRMDRVGVLPEEEVIILGIAICEALTYLHTRTPPVLHRDVKPGNVKITHGGQIYLVDFGLAKVVQNGKATTTGARAMTPGYSPPEQYGTARTDHRTDIYALGATLYSALTDALPEDGLARAMEQCQLTPVRHHNSKVSKRLATVIEKALEVRPEDRYQSAEEFQRDLLNARSSSRRHSSVDMAIAPPPVGEGEISFLGGSSGGNNGAALYDSTPQPPNSRPVSEPVYQAPIPFRRRKKRKAWWLFWLFLLVLIGGGAYVYTIHPEWYRQSLDMVSVFLSPTSTSTSLPEKETSFPISLIYTTTPTFSPTITPQPTVSPTLTITYTPTRTHTSTITPTPTPLGSGSGQIAFASDRTGIPQIWIMNADGTGLVQVTNLKEGACQPDWSPDGKQLVFISPCMKEQESYPGASLFVINLDGSNLRPLITVPGGDYDPAWSPQGNKIAFTSLRNDNQPKVCVIFLWDYTVEILAGEGSKDMQPDWSPDGKRIVFVTNRNGPQQIWMMSSDGSSEVRFSSSGSLKNAFPEWSPDGKAILFTQMDEEIGIPWLVAAAVGGEDTRGVRLYPELSFPLREGSYSPDGLWVVFEAWTEPENKEIYAMFSTGSGLRPLTENPGNDFDAVWRPLANNH